MNKPPLVLKRCDAGCATYSLPAASLFTLLHSPGELFGERALSRGFTSAGITVHSQAGRDEMELFYDLHTRDRATLLANAYRSSLQVAVENNIKSIAFPSLSTGAYRYPLREAASIALKTVIQFLREETHEIELLRFVLFDSKTLETYKKSLGRLPLE